MTVAQLLARARIILDEASAGFWIDTDIYAFLDLAQEHAVTALLKKQRAMRLIKPDYTEASLKPVIKVGTKATTTGVSYSLSTLTDLVEVLDIQITGTGISNHVPLIEYTEWIKQANNTYLKHDTTQPVCYYLGGTLYFSYTTFPNSSFSNINIYYVSRPATVGASQELILTAETHEAILNYALYYALLKDYNQLAEFYLNAGNTLINNL